VGGWTPELTGDRMEAKTCLRCSKQGKSRGKWVTLASRRELPKLLHIVFSQEDSVPGSGKPMAMK